MKKMKKIRKILCIMMVLSLTLGIIGGCGKKESKKENPTSTTTIGELKAKYGETKKTEMMPLYNLSPTDELEIPVKYNLSNYNDFFSVHTDEKCLDASKVAMLTFQKDGKLITKPLMAPLSNLSSDSLWGNVPIYYIKFNFDLESDTEKKLEEPLIVPMTIKSEVDVPTVKAEIKDGNFSIKWDKIKGATSYKIYQRQVIKLLETTNIAPTGKEEAYTGASPQFIGEVNADTNTFSDWLGNGGQNGTLPQEYENAVGGKINSYQNQGVNGEYYVTAVKDGKESLFSVGVSTSTLNLPKELDDSTDISFKSYKTIQELPDTLNVLYVNGDVKPHSITYESKEGTKDVTFTVNGTALIGVVSVDGNTDALSDKKDTTNEVGGFIETENNIDQVPSSDIPTFNKNTNINKQETENKKEEVNKEDKIDKTEIQDKENENTEEDNVPKQTIIEQQIENTKEVVKEAEKETIPEKDSRLYMDVDNAAEEYLALHMMNGDSKFSIAAFPELQTWDRLTDVLMEVIYQNPLILGVRSFEYDYGTMELTISYDYTPEEISERQIKINDTAHSILKQIIKENMSESEKRRAIYSYLEENTSYDDAALESAEANDFMSVDNEFRDSFSTYGILVNKVGVCQSYAFVYDYLCGLADVDCIVVTGYLYGYLPHAWNKVKIDNEWFSIDVTNNEEELGIKDFMYENPDAIAEALGYFEDDTYCENDMLDDYSSENVEYSKYKNILIKTKDDLTKYITEHAKPNAIIEMVVTYEKFCSDDITEALKKTNVKELGSSFVIGGYVYFEILE